MISVIVDMTRNVNIDSSIFYRLVQLIIPQFIDNHKNLTKTTGCEQYKTYTMLEMLFGVLSVRTITNIIFNVNEGRFNKKHF